MTRDWWGSQRPQSTTEGRTAAALGAHDQRLVDSRADSRSVEGEERQRVRER
jgi:hypothetical protein